MVINKGSHSSQTFRVAYILLNCDEGKFSDKVTNNAHFTWNNKIVHKTNPLPQV